MQTETLSLPPDPAAAVESIQRASADAVVLVFKKSPICPISHAAERQLRAFLGRTLPGVRLRIAEIDVIAARPLARGLTAALGIDHESPQALVFGPGGLVWHESHGALTADALEREVRAAAAS